MKNLLILLIASSLFIGCKTENKNEAKTDVKDTKTNVDPVSPEMMETAIIYEANIRQYSEDGSFSAFTKDIPELKKLGVKVIWLMPIFPISETKRKATGGDFASLIEDEATRNKMLGSYYAVSDFTKINPEFGTLEDFRELLNTAHNNGMYVILDWVPNHTGWDHTWLKTNPEFYTKNAKGEITDPLNEDGTPIGWADVADLNYDNKELREEMIKDMMYWVAEENIDGFRCDVAGAVPIDFWKEAIPQLRAKKELFMLAEAWEPELLKGNLFDMAYGWDRHHTLNEMAKGEGAVKAWNEIMAKDQKRYEDDDILMTFVTNHDENSWNGTIKERMGDAAETLTVLSYVAPGMPLIYSGQEYDMDHRLKFFEKDQIPKTKGTMWALLEKLGRLKTTSTALHGGKNAASYQPIEVNNENILMFKRHKNGVGLTFIANVSGTAQTYSNNLDGDYLNYMTNELESFSKATGDITMAPWSYKILIH
ncbi:MAG: alpha-amylase [Flavobacteriaceae bacterium]|nr:alpha-amylase [Flavobacteriaceae bacterium]